MRLLCFFFFNDTATTEIYTLSLHDALPISELAGIYGVIFTAQSRNVTVFADGEVDRSPCGSGTSARLALLDQRGELSRGATLMHESVIGGRFASRAVGETRVADYPAVIAEVEGSAHLTRYHPFVLEAGEPVA